MLLTLWLDSHLYVEDSKVTETSLVVVLRQISFDITKIL